MTNFYFQGPVGVGYACYCVPFFHELENRIEKKTKRIKKQIHRTEDVLNKRLNTIEYCLNSQGCTKAQNCRDSRDNCSNDSPCHTKSFESVFETGRRKGDENKKLPSVADRCEKRKNIFFLKRIRKDLVDDERCYDCHLSAYCESKKAADSSENHCRKTVYSSASLDDNVHRMNFRKTSKLTKDDSCESSDDDYKKITGIPCNDSGYSTKMYSNSQGPSPSLSGE